MMLRFQSSHWKQQLTWENEDDTEAQLVPFANELAESKFLHLSAILSTRGVGSLPPAYTPKVSVYPLGRQSPES